MTNCSSLSIRSEENPANFSAFKDMVDALPQSGRELTKSGFSMWRNISREIVEQFLSAYRAVNHACLDGQGKLGSLLLQYIKKVGAKGELSNWTVAIASSSC